MRCPSHVTLGRPFLGPTFWETSGSILSPIASFFNKSPTQAKVCFNSNKHSFEHHAITSPLMCGCKGKRLVINSSYHTYISFILNPLSYNITYSFWLVTFYSYPSFTMSMWLNHWQFKYASALLPFQEWMYNMPQHTLEYYHNYWRMEQMFRRSSPTFSFTTPNNKWIPLSPNMDFGLWWMLSLLTWLSQIWCNKHRWWQHMQRWYLLRRRDDHTLNKH